MSASSGPAARRKATRVPSGATVMLRGRAEREALGPGLLPRERVGHGPLDAEPLHQDDVEPLAELPPDLPLGADDLEAAGCVQRDRCIVAADDPGHARVEPVGRGGGDQLREQRPTDALALVVAVHVDGVLDRGGVGRPVTPRRQRPEAADHALVRSATTTARAPDRSACHARCSLERARHEVEGRRRRGDLEVVDLPERLGVVEGRQPQLHRRQPSAALGDAATGGSARSPSRRVVVLGRRLDQGHLAGERLEAGPGGHVLVLGEEHDLGLAGRAPEQLEQERLHGRVELLEGVVEQQGHALAGDGPHLGEAGDEHVGQLAGDVVGHARSAVDEIEPRASTSRRRRDASWISSRLAMAQSTGMSPASCCHSARACRRAPATSMSALRLVSLASRPLTRWSWKPR